jgi:ClpA/ClpB-like protein
MFERYTKNARRAIFFARDEASRVGSTCIEAEHLLLGVMRSCDPELNEALELKDLEDALRAELAATGQREITSKRIDIPLANQSKRILAYAAEEAERLNSREIGSAHLLLGIAREPEHRCTVLVGPQLGSAEGAPDDRTALAITPCCYRTDHPFTNWMGERIKAQVLDWNCRVDGAPHSSRSRCGEQRCPRKAFALRRRLMVCGRYRLADSGTILFLLELWQMQSRCRYGP